MTTDKAPDGVAGSEVGVVASLVLDGQRLNCLPNHFGYDMMLFEQSVYGFMRRFASTYKGGYWAFYELSNKGFYMVPEVQSPVAFQVDSNGFEGELTADAAGVVCCLFAYSHLSFKRRGGQRFAEYYHRLLEFAGQHAEVTLIRSAID